MFTVQAGHNNKTFQISEYSINIVQFIFVSSKEKIKKIKRKGGVDKMIITKNSKENLNHPKLININKILRSKSY